jgi:murein DD-endopeptidase MepM/ murein hydrolase activator NlpD
MVKIQHDNGYVSYYAHLKSYNVSNGQRVGQNQVVAFVNSTGSSTGNHLHFELRKNGTAVNPRSVPGVTF